MPSFNVFDVFDSKCKMATCNFGFAKIANGALQIGHLQMDLPDIANDVTVGLANPLARSSDPSSDPIRFANPDNPADKVSAVLLEEEAAAKAFANAKLEHCTARAHYVKRFSLLRRAFKDFGTRTKAYRAEHVAPKEKQLLQAMARWAIAAMNVKRSNTATANVATFQLSREGLRIGRQSVNLPAIKEDVTSKILLPETEVSDNDGSTVSSTEAGNGSDMMLVARHEERAAAQTLAQAKFEHDMAMAKFTAQFSLLKRLGRKARAYRAGHIAPKEKRLKEAMELWAIAAEHLCKQECEG